MAALPDIDQGHVEGFFTGGLLRMLGADGLRKMLAEFRAGRELWKLRVKKEQQETARASQRNPSRMIDGVGQHRLRVDLEAYKYWQLRRPGCWSDKKFRDEFHRDNPECRVTSITKARILHPGQVGAKSRAQGIIAAGKYTDVRSAGIAGLQPGSVSVPAERPTTARLEPGVPREAAA